jgi:HK97 family phage major capsid protein
MEKRNYQIRAGEPLKLEGVAVVFNQPANIGGITEVIAPDALRGVDLSGVVLLTNHNGEGIPLARSPGTMSLTVTERGLEMSAALPETEQARTVYEAVKRGDLSEMSFAFDIGESTFDEKTQTRNITAISKIYEISIVNFAAYKQTTVTARNAVIQESEVNNMYNPITANLETQAQPGDPHATPEYRAAFFKSLLGKELTEGETRAMTAARSEKRADAFNTLSNSASVVPEQTLNEVISQARPVGGLFNEIRLFNVPANLSVPVGTPVDPASWHVEGSNVDRKNVVTTAVTFAAFELIKILSMSAAAQRMTIAAFENYLTRELRESISEAINAAIVHGTGTGQPTGLLTGITWNEDNSIEATTLTADNLLELIAMLPAGYAGGAKFAMSYSTLFSQVYPLKDACGAYHFIHTESGGQHRLFGFEIVVDDNIPAGTILFGNFKYYGANVPQGVLVEVSRESGFTSGLIDYRALCICDAKPILPAAFAKLTVGAE